MRLRPFLLIPRFHSPRHIHGTIEHQTMSLLHNSTTVNQLLQLHSLLLKTSLDHNNFILAKFLARCFAISPEQNLVYARSLFDRIRIPDAFIWNTMIRAYLQTQNPLESISLFHQMQHCEAAVRDSFSFSLVLQACGRSLAVKKGEQIHTQIAKRGFGSDLFVQTALMEMYAKSGDLDTAHQVFDEMPRRDLVSFNVLLAEYVRFGDIGSARQLFDEMVDRDLVTWNTMIHGYASNGNLGAARELFNESSERDLASWSSMIAGYARSRRSNEALQLFHEMQVANVRPDGVTMVSVLSACGDLGALGMGKMVHEYVERNNIELDLKLGTSLVDMYAKCGDIENSIKAFEIMRDKDALAWSAMITGLANHGLGENALDLFSDMVSRGIEPNDITFVGVLTACSHVGLVSKGWVHFRSMSEVYYINPKIEHYGCMVDLLGRAGLLQDARELIKSMPFEPDAVVWRALLGACRIHKNVDIAEEAALKLLELEPRVDGNHVLLSNIYAQAKRWDKVANVRRMIRERKIQKVPGSSSVELGNTVYEFVAGDKSHTKSNEIYEMLSEMSGRLDRIGFKPLTSSVLQDVDEQEKEYALGHHSEKLAIAFALLSTTAGSPIRIVKNLRVCDDCHSAIKLFSMIYDREIIVRDRSRFHHFVGGLCSCRDYW